MSARGARMAIRPTTRGIGLASAGAAALLAARGFGTPALAPVGAGFLVVAVAALALVALAVTRARVERRVFARRPRGGEPVEAEIRLARGGPARVALAALEWDADPGLGSLGPQRARRAAGRTGAIRVTVPRARRGEHVLVPVRLRVTDPFGLAVARRAFGEPERLLVVPRTVPATSDARDLGRVSRDGRPATGQDVAHLDGLREYRRGDPLSRVHWGQSAKRGRLHTKVFRPDDDGGRLVAVLLDVTGNGPEGDVELAVTAAASLARAAAAAAGGGRGGGVVLWAGDGPEPGEASWPETEARLARLRAGTGPGIAEMLHRAARLLPPGTGVVAVTADPGTSVAEAARTARRAGLEAIVLLVGRAAGGGQDLEAAGVPVVRAADVGALTAAIAPPTARGARAPVAAGRARA